VQITPHPGIFNYASVNHTRTNISCKITKTCLVVHNVSAAHAAQSQHFTNSNRINARQKVRPVHLSRQPLDGRRQPI
jgi:hypothetical protein